MLILLLSRLKVFEQILLFEEKPKKGLEFVTGESGKARKGIDYQKNASFLGENFFFQPKNPK